MTPNIRHDPGSTTRQHAAIRLTLSSASPRYTAKRPDCPTPHTQRHERALPRERGRRYVRSARGMLLCMVRSSGKQSVIPLVAFLASGAVFFSLGVVVCVIGLPRAFGGGDIVFVVIGLVGIPVCAFMAVLSLAAIRNVLKGARP